MPALTVCPGEELSLSAFASRLEGADGDSEAAEAARAAMEANLNRHSAAAAQKENVQVMLPPLQLSLPKKLVEFVLFQLGPRAGFRPL